MLLLLKFIKNEDEKIGWILFKVNNKDTRTTSLTCLQCFIVNFELISGIVLVFSLSLWTKNYQLGSSVITLCNRKPILLMKFGK